MRCLHIGFRPRSGLCSVANACPLVGPANTAGNQPAVIAIANMVKLVYGALVVAGGRKSLREQYILLRGVVRGVEAVRQRDYQLSKVVAAFIRRLLPRCPAISRLQAPEQALGERRIAGTRRWLTTWPNQRAGLWLRNEARGRPRLLNTPAQHTSLREEMDDTGDGHCRSLCCVHTVYFVW
jgi:hypothetical protein